MTIFATAHVSMIPYDLSNMFRRHIFFLSVHEAQLSFVGESFRLQLVPFLG